MKITARLHADLKRRFVKTPLPSSATPEQGAKADTAIQPGQAATPEQGARADAAYGWGDHATGVAAAQASANAAQAAAGVAQAGVDAVPALIVAARGQIAMFSHTEASGTHGGTRDAGATIDIPLNTTGYNNIAGMSLLPEGLVSIPAGTYFIAGDVPAFRVDQHRACLFSPASLFSTVQVYGTSEYSSKTAAYAVSRSFVSTVLTFAAATTISLSQYTKTDQATNGGGSASAIAGVREVYGRLMIVRLA